LHTSRSINAQRGCLSNTMRHCVGHACFGLHIMPCWHGCHMFVAHVYINIDTPVLLIVVFHSIGCVLRYWLVRPSPLRKPFALSWLCFSSSWAHQLPRMPDVREIELVVDTHLLNQLNTHATIRYTHSARASDVGHGSASKGPQTSTSSLHSRKCTAWAHNPNGGWGLEPIGPDVNQLHMGGFRSSSAEGTTTGFCFRTERWRTTATTTFPGT
jgi:hypothetical protein